MQNHTHIHSHSPTKIPNHAKPVYMFRAPSSGHDIGWLQTVIGLWHRKGYRSALIKYSSSCSCDRLPDKRIPRENTFLSGFRTGDCSLAGKPWPPGRSFQLGWELAVVSSLCLSQACSRDSSARLYTHSLPNRTLFWGSTVQRPEPTGGARAGEGGVT